MIGKGTEKLFAGDLRVKQYGFVDDMASIISKMDFGICFMKNGGGMKNKIFDYMKYGIPCIINNHVNEYNTVDSDYIYVANDVQDFIKASSIKGLNPVEIKRSIERYEVSNVARDFWKLFD